MPKEARLAFFFRQLFISRKFLNIYFKSPLEIEWWPPLFVLLPKSVLKGHRTRRVGIFLSPPDLNRALGIGGNHILPDYGDVPHSMDIQIFETMYQMINAVEVLLNPFTSKHDFNSFNLYNAELFLNKPWRREGVFNLKSS